MTAFNRRSILTALSTLAAMPLARSAYAKTPALTKNEALVRELYTVAQATSLDADRFVSLFADDGYFLDMSSG